MKKIFKLTDEKRHEDRVLEAVKMRYVSMSNVKKRKIYQINRPCIGTLIVK